MFLASIVFWEQMMRGKQEIVLKDIQSSGSCYFFFIRKTEKLTTLEGRKKHVQAKKINIYKKQKLF